MSQWHDHVVRRGRRIRRIRRAVIVSVTGAAVAGVVAAVPAVLSIAAPNDLSRLKTVTPAQPAGHVQHVPPAVTRLRPPVVKGSTPAVSGTSTLTGRPSHRAVNVTRPQAVPSTVVSALPAAATAPFSLSRALSCNRSHNGTATCPNSFVRLVPASGTVTSHATVETANNGTDVDWAANDTAIGTVTARVWLRHSAPSARVTVTYDVPDVPSSQVSAGNTATNTLGVTTVVAGCPDCSGSDTTRLTGRTAPGRDATLIVDITNTAGGEVPAGWITVKVMTIAFATIGTCDSPCGQPGNGTAQATATTTTTRVSVTGLS